MKKSRLLTEKKGNLTSSSKTILCFVFVLAFLAGTVMPSCFSQVPPGVPQDNDLLKMGYLDVTLLGADSSGRKISTNAIRKAVKYAYNYDLVCFFPSGTYLVDDTIRVMKKAVIRNGRLSGERKYTQLVGSSKERPLIKLVRGATMFQNPENPMPVFWLYSMSALGQQPECEGSTDPLCEQSNINFNQVVISMNFDLGRNSGAVAIRHAGAQGATIEDVNIDARGAFAGIYNPPGQAGGTYNVDITGGQYGIYLKPVGMSVKRTQGKFTIVSGCTFRNQEKAAFHIELPHPMVVVGFHIIKDSGPINEGLARDGLSLIDGVVEANGGQVIEGNNTSLYMQNVYVKGADEITRGHKIHNPGNLTWIREYSYCGENSYNIINGRKNTEEFISVEELQGIPTDKLARKLILEHIWYKNFPNFESEDVVNVMDPEKIKGKPATGDGKTDDTEALEYAIANYEKVFLPKGRYIISRSLKLGKHTQLFGVSRVYTVIVPSKNWKGETNALIETVDDPEATTTLSFINLRDREKELWWKAGRNSMVRDVDAGTTYITGNGGGRWTAFFNVHYQLFIHGTDQALSMYATNPERAKDPEWEIKNAKNVTLYYVKTEAGTDGYIVMTSLRIIDSKNISVFGSTGNVLLDGSNGKGMIEVINCEDIIVTHANPFKQGPDWFTFKEIYKVKQIGIPSSMKLATYKRGEPVIGTPHEGLR